MITDLKEHRIIEIVEGKRSEGLRKFLLTLKEVPQIYEPATNYFRHNFTSGYTEGVNNKIKLIKRQAYGYRGFQGLRLKTLNACM